MKSIIIYFSQTGNTEKVAKAIQQGVISAAGSCDLVKIKNADYHQLAGYDLIGIGCPVIGFQEPMNVMAFINKMRWVGGKHSFIFNTHATRGEFFFPSIVPKLRRKGLTVIGMFDCYGGMGLNLTAGHPDDIDLKEAEEFGKGTVSRSRRISAGETGLIPDYPEWVEYHVKKYIRDRQAKEKAMGIPVNAAERNIRMNYNPEKCNFPKCRACMEACPMEGIDVTIKPPVVGKPCMRCMTCVRVCPTGAMFIPGSDGGPPRLDIPEPARKAMFEEFYVKPLAKAEAEGRFRRLVPVEKVSFDFGGPPASKNNEKN